MPNNVHMHLNEYRKTQINKNGRRAAENGLKHLKKALESTEGRTGSVIEVVIDEVWPSIN